MHRVCCWLTAIVWGGLALAPAPPARGEITADEVRTSIERAVEFLKRQQSAAGHWSERNGYLGGVTALCTLALLTAGVPPDDKQLQRALAWLRGIECDKTYSVALQTMALAAAEPARDLEKIRRNVRWLERAQIHGGLKPGNWGYDQNDRTGDNSNGQFALLALHEAERAGVAANTQTWRRALAYWLGCQAGDGSWNYERGGGGAATGSMTCAGITSVIIASARLNRPDAQVEGDQIRCCAGQEKASAVERGLGWLARNFSVTRNPGGFAAGPALYDYYYLYGLERVGRLSAQRYIGGHDWYREGCDVLVRRQDRLSGFWRSGGDVQDTEILTSFALLFLAKGRRPVLVSKLAHAPDDDWNHHRHDLANLTQYVESRWRRDLAWQVIDLVAATADDLLQSPVLFLSGRERPQLNDAQVAVLREYLDRGGFLLAEACCDGDAFDEGFRALISRMYPESERRLYLLPPDHAVWRAEEPLDPKFVRPLWGLDVGCRTSVVYSPSDLSCLWELSRSGRGADLSPAVVQQITAANTIGINILAYATNRELKFRYEDFGPQPVLAAPRDALARAKLQLARLKHSGGWDAAPLALVNLQRILSDELGLRIDTDAPALALSDEQLFRYHLVFMHGRNDFRLSEAERGRLKEYLQRGGMLVADAVCASEAFARAFRREVEALFPERTLERIAQGDPLFTTKYGGFDLATVSRREPQGGGQAQPLAARVRRVPPDLEAITLDGRYAVIFSPFDLSCALEQHESLECPGYLRQDAARIAINLVLYSLHE